MTDLPHLRETYRRNKAEALRMITDCGASTRGVRNTLRALSGLADELLCTLWRQAGLDAPFALVAVGGFGRGELFPHSDVDVLVLLPDDAVARHQSVELKARIESFIGSCWDAGLEIGSSVRTLADCLAEAAKDVTVQTSLLEARLVDGDATAVQRCSSDALTPSWIRRPSLSRKRWNCASATPSSRTRPTRLSPTARNRPGACATCRSSSGWHVRPAWAGAGRNWPARGWPHRSRCDRSSTTRPCSV